MSIKLEAEFDTAKLDVFINRTSQRVLGKAVARSLNRTITTVRKEAAQEIRKNLKLPAKQIKDGLPIKKKARPNQPIDVQEATIGASTKPLSLRLFKPKQNRKGVAVNITGKRQIVRSAFLAKGQVFRRVRVRKPGTRIRRVDGRSELPIEKQSYKSIARLLEGVGKKIVPSARQKFNVEFMRNFEHLISRGR